MKRKLFFLAAFLLATVMNLQAAEAVSYLYPEYNTSGNPTSGIKAWKTGSCTDYTVVENCTTAVAWNAGWYVVKGTSVEITQAITCSGAVHLILADGAQLTAKKGIKVSEDANSITIYGQSNQTGTLIATGGSRAAGIGGSGRYGKNITINGGKVTATGGSQAAGIGGGRLDYGQNITINGGTVTATGGQSAAGIGGGDSGWGSNITINGGTLTATGGKAAAGIGGGNSSSGLDITINGGTVNANGGLGSAGIGGGINNNGSNITISGGIVTATGGGKAAGIGGGSASSSGNGNGSDITISGGIVTATGGEEASGIGGGCYGNCSNITISGGTVTATGGSNGGVGIGKGVGGFTASNIFVDPALVLKADGTNPPTTVIAHASITTDVASDLAGKKYATVAPPAGPDTLNYLHFVSLKAGGSVKMSKKGTPAEPVLEYSKDNRKSWSKFDIANGTTFDNVGDTIWFRAGKDGVAGKNATISKSIINYYYFAFGENDSIAAGGNVMSLLDGTCAQKSVPDGSFSYLFSNAKQLISAPELPATTIAGYCYAYMFYNCTNLVTAPELPATTIASNCYVAMFRGCTKLENGPTSLPAAVLETSCYSYMFYECAKLKNAPAMNVTTLAMMCCYSMFSGCSHLMVDPYEGECDGVEMQFNHEGSEPSSWNSTMFAGCQGTVSQPTIGGHYCVKGVKDPDMHDFLYFVSLKDNGTVKLNKVGKDYANLTATFEYSTDRIKWTEYTWPDDNGKTGYAINLAHAGDTVFFRALGANKDGKNAEMSISTSVYFIFKFGTNDSIAAGGNAMSLYDATCEQKTMTDYGFTQLLKVSKQLISAPKLPATTLAPSCYIGMFQNCKSLITSQDELPATTLVEACYEGMFKGCTALTQAPELKATTLAYHCYAEMFSGCSALEVNTFSSSCDGAELVVPDTTAAPAQWNSSMFLGCKGDAADNIQLGGHYCISEYKEPDMHDFLYFVSLKDNGTVQLDKLAYEEGYLSKLTATFEYSKNRKIWREYTWDAYKSRSCKGLPIALNQGDTVFFRAKGVNGKNNELSNAMSSYRFAFGENDSIAAGGNAMSLYDATCEQDAMTAYGFYKLFVHDGSMALVSAPKLPATKLAEKCYASMFNECVALTTAPALPATELAKGCYEAMFSGCEALPQAPELNATEVVEWCYYAMFQTCHALTAAPELPAMELAKNCYAYMFYDCPALTKAPALMAFTLADSCYMNMFTECSKLEVNVNTISKSCDGVDLMVPQTSAAYDWNFEMFSGCKGDAALTAEYGIQLNGHYCISEYKEPDMHDMLHFVSLKDNGTVKLNKYGGTDLDKLTATFEYSTDRKTWTEYTWGGTDNKKGAAITLASAGDTVFFRAKGDKGKNATLSYNDVTYFLFAFNTGDSIAAGGNVMSLYDAECKQDTMTAYGFSNLFKDCAKKLVSVSELKLPVTKLAKGCYYAMFYNCMKITDVPALPVTTLAPSCYVFMFYRCSSLTVAPVLPATTLADNCYSNMFSGCTALTQAPVLPAITLASKCYNLMFAGCSSLTVAPELNATTLADSCYKQMFKGCSKLEVDTCSGSCAGVVFVPTTMGYAPINWNLNMFDGCRGDAKYTAEHGIQLGGHYCIREYKEPDMHDMLYLVSLKDNGSVHLDKSIASLSAAFQYSTDRKNWTDYTWPNNNGKGGLVIALPNASDTVFFRAGGETGKNATLGTSSSAYFSFAFGENDSIAAGGNTMSLYDATCEQDTMTKYGFSKLFYKASQLVSAKELKLPATKLAEYCYNFMFYMNSHLTIVLDTLPATNLEPFCYNAMFLNCKSLAKAPALPATVLARYCYSSMFSSCNSLVAAPALSATTLSERCYQEMFLNCTSLEVNTFSGSCDGAELVVPATGATDWNSDMFKNCHGAYANNIQLNGHYCIKKFVPDSIKGVTITDYEGVYDGLEHFITVNGTIEGDVVTYSTDSATWKDAITLKDVSDTTVFVRIQRTDHYDWYGKSSITITPRHITLTSGSATKAYDATPLTCEQVTVGGDEFVDGEGADYSNFYSVKYVSPTGAPTPNTFTYVFNESTKATNYVMDTVYGMLNITPSPTPIEITAGNGEKMYDGEPFFYNKGFSVTGEFFGKDNLNRIQMKDTVVNVGTYPNRILICFIENNSGQDVTPCYGNITFVDGTLEITPRELFVSGLTMQDKIYDGTDSAAVGTEGVLEGVVGSDDVNIAATTATFADANAGKDKEVTVIYTLGGNDANNYSISEEMASATINKRELTLESADLTKEYDGTPLTAEGTTIVATGYVAGECLSYSLLGSQTAVGESANSFDYSDSDSAKVMNYDVTAIYGKLKVIASTELITITAGSASKVYDGTPLTNNGYQVDGTLAAGDYMGNVVVTGSITQVGSVPNEVTGYGIYNAAGEDVTEFYSNIQTVDTTLTITPKQLTITGSTISDKEYDGHNRFIATAGTLSGVIAGDEVNVLSVGYAGDKNVGQAKQVVVEHTLYGAAVDNYLAPANDTLTASITPKELTVSGIVVDEKLYDGTTTAVVSAAGTLQGVIAPDDVSIDSATGAFADKNAGKDKDVTIVYTLKGEDAANYDVLDGESYATITKRELTLESADLTKEYDGTPLTAKGTTIKADGYVAGECLTYSLLGSQTAVGESANSFDYSDSETALVINYDVTAIYGTLTVIKSSELITITANSDSKVYDGTPLTNNGYQVDGTLAAGDYVGNVVVTGTITEVGSVPNEVTGYGIYNASGEDVTTFYSNIQRVAGTLIVVSDQSTCAEANLVEAELPIGLQTVTVAYVNDAYTYIQDETGGALIYANNYGLKAGDRVSGLRGISKPTEGGLPRIIPTVTVEQLTPVSGIAPQPKVMNEAPSMDIINQYVRYEDITIVDGLVDNVLFPNAISNAQWMNTTPMVFNNVFPNAHYLGYDQRFDVVATVGVENGEIQLYPALFAIHEGEGVENVNGNDNHNLIEKLMINGVLMIRVNGILYNASGVRVQ